MRTWRKRVADSGLSVIMHWVIAGTRKGYYMNLDPEKDIYTLESVGVGLAARISQNYEEELEEILHGPQRPPQGSTVPPILVQFLLTKDGSLKENLILGLGVQDAMDFRDLLTEKLEEYNQ